MSAFSGEVNAGPVTSEAASYELGSGRSGGRNTEPAQCTDYGI